MNKGEVLGYFRECSNLKCAFRFPDLKHDPDIAYCPKCGALASISNTVISESNIHCFSEDNPVMIPLLDNIRSVYNVGSIIRTCEGLGISEIILAGITPTPEHPRMNKTSLGAIPKLKWHYLHNGLKAVTDMKSKDYQVISLESTRSALPIEKVQKKNLYGKICLVAGNENLGIDPAIQELSDMVVAIPMSGEKESFNVSVAFGIAAFHLIHIARI